MKKTILVLLMTCCLVIPITGCIGGYSDEELRQEKAAAYEEGYEKALDQVSASESYNEDGPSYCSVESIRELLKEENISKSQIESMTEELFNSDLLCYGYNEDKLKCDNPYN